MTKYRWTAEGGTDGANVAVSGSSASGPAIGVLMINGASTPAGSAAVKYDDAAAREGNLGVRMLPGAGATYLSWTESAPTSGRGGVRRSYTAATPSAQVVIAAVRSTAPAMMAEMRVLADGRIVAADADGNLIASAFTPTPGTTYFPEVWATPGTTTANGTVELIIYGADRTTVVHTWSSAACNTGTVGAASYRIGGFGASSGWAQDDVDGIAFGSAASGVHGADTAPITGEPTIGTAVVLVDARGLTGGSGALTHSSSSSGVTEVAEGLFAAALTTVAHDVTITSTDGTLSKTSTVTVPATTAVVGMRRRVWSGTAWL